ncbi:putative glycosyltransferase [Burkholderia sp. Ch1-1]|nr:putative glycosyltransferase [Burkholderia sp. Ch1-1]
MRWSMRPRSLNQLLRGVQQAIRVRGGALPLARAVAGVVRSDGLGGVRRLLGRAAAAADDYAGWIRRYDTIDAQQRAALRAEAEAMISRPLISVVVPVYNTPDAFLREMIESVRAQLYPEWELCICDDASTAPHVAKTLTEYAACDPRIKVVRHTRNGHICAASNDACALAGGRFIALLDHDDILPEHALLMVARYVERFPDARMLFSDEDKLALDGQRVEPYFKSDWNPVLMLGQNMFSHLGVFETTLLRDAGGFRAGFEGSQDHDLALRCSERIDAKQIVHIPHVLYHWRLSAESTAGNVAAKPYAREASLRAVREHLQRLGHAAKVETVSDKSSMVRVTFEVPEPKPLVSIVIPTRDRSDLLKRCVDSLREQTRYEPFEIIIVDNGSTDSEALALLERYAQQPNVTVLRVDAPFNFSALNNEAVAHAQGTLLCLFNNDLEVTQPDWLDILCGYALLPETGAAGAALWYPDDRLQHGGVVLGGSSVAGHMHHLLHRGEPGYFGRAMLAQQVSAVTAACLVVRKSLYESVGGLDASGLGVAYNDVDFCLKLDCAGYRNVYVPYASLYHYESATRGRDADGERAERLLRESRCMHERWGAALWSDVFYNPNLAIEDGRFFKLASPPRVRQFE